jgi:hypothetical protein
VRELIERRREESSSPVENEELEEYLRLEHLMIMAKARAQLRLKHYGRRDLRRHTLVGGGAGGPSLRTLPAASKRFIYAASKGCGMA